MRTRADLPDRLREMWALPIGRGRLARQLGVSHHTLQRVASELGLTDDGPVGPNLWPLARVNLLEQIWPVDPSRVIVEKINALPGNQVSLRAIKAKATAMGLKRERPKNPSPAEDKFLSDIRRLIEAGYSSTAIAIRLDANRTTISRIMRRNGLKCVGGKTVPMTPRARKKPLNDSRVSPKIKAMHHICIAPDSAPPAAANAQTLSYGEIVPIAKRFGCWRSTQDFLLSELNEKLAAAGYKPVRIRPWQPGQRELPARELRL